MAADVACGIETRLDSPVEPQADHGTQSAAVRVEQVRKDSLTGLVTLAREEAIDRFRLVLHDREGLSVMFSPGRPTRQCECPLGLPQ
jgi:hypothetical protein